MPIASTIGAIAAGVSAATGLASGIAAIAGGGDKRPELGGAAADVAGNLANSFARPISGTPQLGQNLGPGLSRPAGAPNIGDIKQRLAGVGQTLGMGTIGQGGR